MSDLFMLTIVVVEKRMRMVEKRMLTPCNKVRRAVSRQLYSNAHPNFA